MRVRSGLLTALSVLFLAGCPRPPEEISVIEMEPVYFTLLQKGDRVEVKDYDSNELFVKAEEQFRAGQYMNARKLYLLVAAESGDRESQGLAWFNVALCDVSLEKPGSAMEAIEKAEKLLSDEEDLLTLRLVKVQVLALQGRWAEVEREGLSLLQKEIPPVWLGRVHLNLGQAALVDRRLEEAQQNIERSIDLMLSNTTLKDQYRNRSLAMAYYRLASVYRELFNRLKFQLPVERMMIDMADKQALMRKTEDVYLLVVRVRDPEFSPDAGYQIGRLYEQFAADLIEAEVPQDLDDLELQVYTEELNLKVIPYLRRAQEIYKRNSQMCDTYSFPAKWKRESEAKVKEIEETIASLGRADTRSKR